MGDRKYSNHRLEAHKDNESFRLGGGGGGGGGEEATKTNNKQTKATTKLI